MKSFARFLFAVGIGFAILYFAWVAVINSQARSSAASGQELVWTIETGIFNLMLGAMTPVMLFLASIAASLLAEKK